MTTIGMKRPAVWAKQRFFALPWVTKLILVALVVAIGWFGIRPLIAETQEEQPEYQTAQAEKGTLITSVSATGSVSSLGGANVTTNASGVVKEVRVKNGDTVAAGDTIAILTLDQASLQKQTAAWASYLSAQNAVNTAKSKMNSLQAALFEASDAFTNGAGTDDPKTDDPQYIIERATWLQAEANYTQQAAAIRQTKAALSSAWLSYAQTSATITAPISGTVSNLTLTAGTPIAATTSNTNSTTTAQSYGSIVLSGGNPQAIVNVSEIDVTTIAVDQKTTLTLDAFPDKTFTGKVTAINTNGSVSSGVTNYPVTITFDTAMPTMYPNMAVSATIITGIKDTVILVPSAAVQTSNGQSTIRIMKDNQVNAVTVEVGQSNATQTEIVSGIAEGDTVVTGQTTSTTTSTQTTTSPFGTTRGGAFGGGGGQIRIQR